MQPLYLYFLKLTISLAVVFLFYQLVLRKLTFYNWNRWYLLGYSFLSFFIPLINIFPLLQEKDIAENEVIAFIPPIEAISTTQVQNPVNAASYFDIQFWIDLLFFSGVLVTVFRLLVFYLSFLKLKQGAHLIADSDIKIYQVNKNIIPFSFGNAVFINSALHNEQDLKEIICHEFIHVKQKHTIDIIWCELLCIINWYNPLAWLIRKAVRQNLEFIADSNVLQNGIDKKEYQYLLLKVIGVPQFSIAPQFNFTSLKKRIIMMNKIKSAKVHLLKFLFIAPVLLVVLVSFRNYSSNKEKDYAGIVLDIGTYKPIAGVQIKEEKTGAITTSDANGYYSFSSGKNENNNLHFTFSKDGYADMFSSIQKQSSTGVSTKYVELVGMKVSENKEDRWGCFSKLNLINNKQDKQVSYSDAYALYQTFLNNPHTENSATFFERNKVQNLIWQTTPERIALIYLKNGTVEKYKINNENEYRKLIDKYGKLPFVPAAATKGSRSVYSTKIDIGDTVVSIKGTIDTTKLPNDFQWFLARNGNVKRLWWKENEVFIELKSGERENYSLNDKQSMTTAEKKYGKFPSPPPPPPKVNIEKFTPPAQKKQNTPTSISKAFATDSLIFSADSMVWNSNKKVMELYGDVALKQKGYSVIVNEKGGKNASEDVLLNGTIVQPGESIKTKNGESYSIRKLEPEEANKIYGTKGKRGVIEIVTLK